MGYASRFGRSAAKAGVTDALVGVASTARKRTTAKRSYEAIILEDELEALRALVPAAPPDDVANYIVIHHRKLVFNPATKTYSISSADTRQLTSLDTAHRPPGHQRGCGIPAAEPMWANTPPIADFAVHASHFPGAPQLQRSVGGQSHGGSAICRQKMVQPPAFQPFSLFLASFSGRASAPLSGFLTSGSHTQVCEHGVSRRFRMINATTLSMGTPAAECRPHVFPFLPSSNAI